MQKNGEGEEKALSAFANVWQAIKKTKGMGKHFHSNGTAFQSVSRELLNPTNPSARSSIRGVQH